MTLTPNRLARESLPLAVVIAVWTAAAFVVGSGPVGGRLGLAGTIMGALYALVRGTALADEAGAPFSDRSPAALLRENGLVLLGAAPWFLAAAVSAQLLAPLSAVPGLRPVVEPIESLLHDLAPALASVGTLTVLLYAVATATASLREAAPVFDVPADAPAGARARSSGGDE